MEFFCYHRDRATSTALRIATVEQHWTYMDAFASTMIARGPTFTDDGTLTGSVHILDLASPAAARQFAFEEPGYQTGAYRDVMLRRWHDALGRSMGDHGGGNPDRGYYLVLGFTQGPAHGAPPLPDGEQIILSGLLLSDDATWILGAAILMESDHPDDARNVLAPHAYVDVEVHQWRPGGRHP